VHQHHTSVTDGKYSQNTHPSTMMSPYMESATPQRMLKDEAQ